jgi:enoyl-CoA hydratase/carnithine racemase
MLHESDDGHVRVLTLDRPEARNAFDRSLYVALADALRRAASDESVHVVVITGAGTVFSAGQDLKEMAAMISGEIVLDGPHGFPALLEILEEIETPIIAAVNGAGAGVGMTMLLHCDIVLIADTARLRVPFTEMGVPPEAASSVLMPQALGWQRAAELLFTSRWVSGEEAARIGLAMECVPAADLMERAMGLAQQIAANQPAAVRTAKRLMLAARTDLCRAARAREDEAFKPLFSRQPDVA